MRLHWLCRPTLRQHHAAFDVASVRALPPRLQASTAVARKALILRCSVLIYAHDVMNPTARVSRLYSHMAPWPSLPATCAAGRGSHASAARLLHQPAVSTTE
jgi:hypothetical protein